MNNLVLITITEPNTDPKNVLDKFLRSNDVENQFIPVVSTQKAEEKRKERIAANQERVKEGLTENEKKQALEKIEKLQKMSLSEFVKSWYGVSDFNPASDSYGYFGNPEDHMFSYFEGDNALPLKEGKLANKAQKKDVDWKKLEEIASIKGELELLKTDRSGSDASQFVAARTKVHARPVAFVAKNGKWYQEDSMSDDPSESLKKYQQIWEESIESAQPEDVFTHWTYEK